MKFGIVQFVGASAREYHYVETVKLLLMMTKTLPYYAFEAIAIDGQTNMFLGDDQTESGLGFRARFAGILNLMTQGREQENFRTGSFDGLAAEYQTVFGRIEQALGLFEGATGRQRCILGLSEAVINHINRINHIEIA